MKFTVKTESITSAISKVVRALPKDAKSAQKAIYMGVLIQARDEQIVLSGFDGTVWVRAKIDAVVKTPNNTCVPGRMLNDILKYISDDEIEFEIIDNKLQLTTTTNSCQVAIYDWVQYPSCPAVPTSGFVSIPSAHVFSSALQACLPTILVDKPENIPAQKMPLIGIYATSTDSGFKFLSTTGKAATKIEVPCEEVPQFEICVPGRVAEDAKALFADSESINFAVENPFLYLESDSLQVISSSLLNYPASQAEKFFKQPTDTSVIVDRVSLVDALAQAELFAHTNDPGIYFLFDASNQEITVQSAISDYGTSSVSIAANVESSAESDFGNRYLLKQVLEILRSIKTLYVQLLVNEGPSALYVLPAEEKDGEVKPDSRMVGMSMSLDIKDRHQLAKAVKEESETATKTKAPGATRGKRKKAA